MLVVNKLTSVFTLTMKNLIYTLTYRFYKSLEETERRESYVFNSDWPPDNCMKWTESIQIIVFDVRLPRCVLQYNIRHKRVVKTQLRYIYSTNG